MLVPLSPQVWEIWTDTMNDKYNLINENNWEGIERDFTIRIKYLKNAGDLGKNGVFINEEN